MDTSNLMEQILSNDNLNKEHLAKNGEIIKEQLRTRKYKPQPVRREEQFHDHSYGFRPNRCAQQAI